MNTRSNRVFCFQSLLFVVSLILCCELPAHAQQRSFGAGIIIGDPTGFTGKYWKNRENAYDFGLAWSLGKNDSVQLYGDYLWHRFELIDEERTPLYFGVGAWLGSTQNSTGLGARFPLGITHLFERDPIGVFFEVVPVIRIIPDTNLEVQGGFGARYYFNAPRRR